MAPPPILISGVRPMLARPRRRGSPGVPGVRYLRGHTRLFTRPAAASARNGAPGFRARSCAAIQLRYPFLLQPMHDLNYFREHLADFEQMAVNRGARIDFD